MKEIDEFLEFLMDHKEDDRLLFSKKMKDLTKKTKRLS